MSDFLIALVVASEINGGGGMWIMVGIFLTICAVVVGYMWLVERYERKNML